MLDKHGRNIEYLRVSLTDRCNLRCIYCMPECGIEKVGHDDILRFEETLKIIKVFSSLGIRKIRFTGGEPLILKGIDKLIYDTSKIPTIEDVSITTNGIFLGDMASELKKAGLKRVNISLDTLNKDKFKFITRGGNIDKVLGAIDKCLTIGLEPVKINMVLIRGINDGEIQDFLNLVVNNPVHVRIIELMPIGEGQKFYKEGMITTDEIVTDMKDLIPVDDESSTAKVYRTEGSKGTIGFISPLSCKFCDNCNRIRLTSTGVIKPCLHSKEEINIKSFLDNEVLLTSMIKSAIYEKPNEHKMEISGVSSNNKMMYQIGG